MTGRGKDEIDQLGATIAVSEVRPSNSSETSTSELSPSAVPSSEAFSSDLASSGVDSSDLGVGATMSLQATGTRAPASSEFAVRPFGPYTTVELLDQQGAMGIVAKGFNGAFRRWELLKFLRGDQADEELRERQFLREGRVLARLSHPNVVQVFAIHQVDGRPCLAMEYLHGCSLSAYMAEHGGQLPVPKWYELFLDAARGLSAAHQVGLLHRDLKPDNLFVVRDDAGRVGGLKLIDFGLATAVRARRDGDARDSGLVADLSGGTPVYMAPELWGGTEGSPTSDVFALAMSFYHALAGRLPFEAEVLARVIRVVTSREPFPSPRQYRPDLPAPLAEVVSKALAKRPEDRFSNAEDLLSALVAAGEASRPRRVPGSGPYRGLAHYTTEERDVFFGRDVETAEVLERLRTRAGVVVVGPDGVGKTSLIQAAVLPGLEAGALGFGIDYKAVRVESAHRPLHALAAATASATAGNEKQILAFLQRTPERLAEALRESAVDQRGFVVVADPLEALLGDDVEFAEALAFSRALASIVEVPRPELRLLATVRADRVDRLFVFEPLRPLLNHGFFPLRPLAGDALRKALSEPAHTAGFEFEETSILDEIVKEAELTSAGLPLASFAMAAWWERRDVERHMLPASAWHELGGLRGALVRHAESVVSSMGQDDRATTEVLLARLVSADGERLRVSRADLVDPAVAGPDASHALDLLVDARVVQESFGTVELAHDALVTSWPRVQSMREASGEDWAFRERVAAAAHAWDSQGRPDGALWTGDQAARLSRWLSSSGATLTQTELSFAEVVRKRASLKKLLLRSGLIAGSLILIGFAVAAKSNEVGLRRQLAEAVEQRNQASEAFRRAEADRLRLEAESVMGRDPRGALDAALTSYELKADPALDAVAWRAHAMGIPTLLPAQRGPATFVRFAPNGKWLATATADGEVNVLASIDAAHFTLRVSDAPDARAAVAAFSPEGQSIAIGMHDGTIAIGAAPTFEPLRRVQCQGQVVDVGWVDETAVLATCSAAKDAETVVRIATPTMDLTPVAQGRLASKLKARGFAMLLGPNAIARYDGGALTPPIPVDTGAAVITAVGTSTNPGDMVLGLGDGRVMRWVAERAEGQKGEGLQVLARHDAAVTSVGISADSDAVLSFSEERRAVLTLLPSSRTIEWDTSRELATWIPARHAVVLAGPENEAIVVSTQTGEELGRLRGATRPLISFAPDPSGRWFIATSADGNARVYVLEEALLAVARPPVAPRPSKCAVSPDAAWVACADKDAVVAHQMLREGREAAAPRRLTTLPSATVNAIHVSAGGARILWASGPVAGENDTKLSLPGAVLSFASSARPGPIAAIGAAANPFLRIWPSQVVPSLGAARPSSIAISASGQTVIAGCDDGTARLTTPDNPTLTTLRIEGISQAGTVTAVAASDDDQVVAMGTRRGLLAMGSAAKSSLAAVHRVDDAVECLAFARSSNVVLFVTRGGRAGFADSAGHGWFATGVIPSPVAGCARSPVDDRFTLVSEDGSVRVRWFDLGPIASSRAPEPGGQGRKGPRIESWRGLPTERTW